MCNSCQTCAHAIKSSGGSVTNIRTATGQTIIMAQSGQNNTACSFLGPKSVTITDGELTCTAYMPE